jgi:hypothetical protein
MDINLDDESLYKPECRLFGPLFVNCCICCISNIASCLLCLQCKKEN